MTSKTDMRDRPRRKAVGLAREFTPSRPEEARMSTVDGRSGEAGGTARSEPALEVVVTPVAHADPSKAFYADLGWRLDADFSLDNGFRVAPFTPPGSLCSYS